MGQIMGGRALQLQGGGDVQRNAVRHTHQLPGGNGGKFGVTAEVQAIGHLVPGGDGVDPGADLFDDACAFHAGDERRRVLIRHRALENTGAHIDVDEVDTG